MLPAPSMTTLNVAPVPSIVDVDATPLNVVDAVYAAAVDVADPILAITPRTPTFLSLSPPVTVSYTHLTLPTKRIV